MRMVKPFLAKVSSVLRRTSETSKKDSVRYSHQNTTISSYDFEKFAGYMVFRYGEVAMPLAVQLLAIGHAKGEAVNEYNAKLKAVYDAIISEHTFRT